ncbi:MAG: GNAT family N-acetyltransferase [Alphaproteobacteria bacterium]
MTLEGLVLQRAAMSHAPRDERTPRTGATTPVSVRWWPAGAWETLEADIAGLADISAPNIFLDPGFALPARDLYPANDLGAVIVTDAQGLLAFIPGRLRWIAHVFQLWTTPVGNYGSPLVRPGAEALAVKALFSQLAEMGITALHAPLLDDDHPFTQALIAHASETASAMTRFYRHERAVLRHGDALRTHGGIGKEYRRLIRRLAETGAITRLSTRDNWPLATAIDTFLALEKAGWKGRSGTAFAARLETRRFFIAVCERLGAQGKLSIDAMMRDDKAVAAAITLRAGSRAWFWKITYDEELARFSPGVQATLALSEALLADETLVLTDSCAISGHPMIDRIWSARMALEDYFVAVAPGAPSARFRLLVAAETSHRRLRERAKRFIKRSKPAPATGA